MTNAELVAHVLTGTLSVLALIFVARIVMRDKEARAFVFLVATMVWVTLVAPVLIALAYRVILTALSGYS